MNNIFKIGLLLIIAMFVSTMPAMAIQDPYPLDGYVIDNNGVSISGATINITNQNTSDVLNIVSRTSGWYTTGATNFPFGYVNGGFV